MSNAKISELTELAETPNSLDIVPIVDVSTSATKKVTISNLLNASPLAGGVLALPVQASAPGNTTDYGKIYVKQSDNVLYYLDEDGNETPITASTAVPGMYIVGTTGSGADYITDGTADEVQINQAITAANGDGGGTVLILPGTYNAAANITLKSGVNLIGCGYGTLIYLDTASIKPAASASNIVLSNFRVDGTNNDYSVDSMSLEIRNCSDLTIDRVWCTNSYGFSIFVTADSSNTTERVRVNNCYFYSIGNQDTFGGGPANSTGAIVKDIIITNNYIIKDITSTSTNKNGWDMVAVTGLTFTGNTVYGHVNSGFEQDYPNQQIYANNRVYKPIGAGATDFAELAIDTFGNGGSPSPYAIIIEGNYVEGGRIRLSGKSGVLLVHANVNGNMVYSDAGASNQHGIFLEYAFYINIHGNNLEGDGGDDGIRIDANSGAINATGNIIHAFSNGINDISANLTNNFSDNEIFNCTVGIAGSPLGTVHNNIGANPVKRHAQGNVTGATTFNRINGDEITATLTGSITVTLTAATAVNDELTLVLTQDGTGGRTVTWPSNFKKAGGTLTLSTAASAVDVIKMKYDGSNWREVSRALNQS